MHDTILIADKLATGIGQIIRDYCVRSGLQVETIATYLEVTCGAYEMKEGGHQRFGAGELVLLCDFFDVSPSTLFERLH